jgi:hypothetical protein
MARYNTWDPYAYIDPTELEDRRQRDLIVTAMGLLAEHGVSIGSLTNEQLHILFQGLGIDEKYITGMGVLPELSMDADLETNLNAVPERKVVEAVNRITHEPASARAVAILAFIEDEQKS